MLKQLRLYRVQEIRNKKRLSMSSMDRRFTVQMLHTLFADKSIKGKEKTEQLSSLLINHDVTLSELIKFIEGAKDSVKATCIEALEFVTQKNSSYLTLEGFQFITESLASKTPRVKWESARVIGNTAQHHQNNLDQAIVQLLKNTEDPGTVVRWSAAYALSAIYSLPTKYQPSLQEAIKAIIKREEKNSIRKIYQAALKKG
jgi:hypothetical protein